MALLALPDELLVKIASSLPSYQEVGTLFIRVGNRELYEIYCAHRVHFETLFPYRFIPRCGHRSFNDPRWGPIRLTDGWTLQPYPHAGADLPTYDYAGSNSLLLIHRDSKLLWSIEWEYNEGLCVEDGSLTYHQCRLIFTFAQTESKLPLDYYGVNWTLKQHEHFYAVLDQLVEHLDPKVFAEGISHYFPAMLEVFTSEE